jgi:hypothetical protein
MESLQKSKLSFKELSISKALIQKLIQTALKIQVKINQNVFHILNQTIKSLLEF